MKETIKKHIRRPRTWILIAIIAFAAYARFKYAFVSGMWVDEGRHGVIATSLLENPFSYSSPYHGAVTGVPPVYPYLLMVSMAILGWGKTALYAVSPVMGVIGVFFVYLVGRTLFGEEEGLIAAAFLATNPVHLLLSGRVLIGVTLTTLYTATLGCVYYATKEDRPYAKYAMWAAGPLAVLTLLTKQPGALLAPIIVIYLAMKWGWSMFDPREHREVYVAAGLGLLVLFPWLIRNVSTCSSLFCSSGKAATHLFKSSFADWANTQGTFYYFTGLSRLLSLPVAIAFYFRYTVIEAAQLLTSRSAKRVYWALGGTLVGVVVAYTTLQRLVPLVLLLGIVAIQDSDERRFLWLWIALGLGFMSIVQIKIPRYVIFVYPAFLLLIGRDLIALKEFVAEKVDVNPLYVLAGVFIVVAGIAGMSYTNGVNRIDGISQGFQELEPAGRWFKDREVSVLASSPRQIMFYSGNSIDAELLPTNASEAMQESLSGDYDYVVLDMYERTRSEAVRRLMQEFNAVDTVQPVEVFRQQMGGQEAPVVVIYRVGS